MEYNNKCYIDNECGNLIVIQHSRSFILNCFSDGNGSYTVRFMSAELGISQYKTTSNTLQLSNKTDSFNVINNKQ